MAARGCGGGPSGGGGGQGLSGPAEWLTAGQGPRGTEGEAMTPGG